MRTFLKRNIFLLVPATGKGGVTTRSAKWAKQLIQKGHDVKVVFWEDSSSPYHINLERSPFESIPQVCVKFDSRDKLTVTIPSLLKSIEFSHDAIIISGGWKYTPALVNEARRQGTHLTYLETLVGDDESNYQMAFNAISICDGILTIGQRIKNRLIHKLPEKHSGKLICAVSPGSQVPATCPKRSCGTQLNICYAGRLDPIQKRIYDLVEIVDGLNQKGVDFHLEVIGGGNEKQKLVDLCKKRNLSEKVTFHGKVPFAQVSEIMFRNSVFLLPSAFEGFSGALCEAMATGLIPIATRVSGTEDVVRNSVNGRLLEVGDINGFVDVLAALAGNDAELMRMSENAWKTARNELSIEHVVCQIEQFIAEVMKSPIKYQSEFHSHQGVLNATWMPNVITRAVRMLWRMYRGLPKDVAPK